MQAEIGEGRRASWRFAVAPLILVAVIAALLVAGGATPGSCAGQCQGPYLVDVTFSPATTAKVATSQVQRCASNPEVVGIGPAGDALGGMTVPVYTHDLGRNAKTAAVLSCLSNLPAVQAVGYPS